MPQTPDSQHDQETHDEEDCSADLESIVNLHFHQFALLAVVESIIGALSGRITVLVETDVLVGLVAVDDAMKPMRKTARIVVGVKVRALNRISQIHQDQRDEESNKDDRCHDRLPFHQNRRAIVFGVRIHTL